jgi:hypothetical protein
MSDYPNSGILNPNKYKRPGTKQPDMNGKAAVNCKHCQKETEFELAAWSRGNFTTLTFTEKTIAEAKRAAAKAAKAGLPPPGDAPAQSTAPAPEETNTESAHPYDDVPFDL